MIICNCSRRWSSATRNLLVYRRLSTRLIFTLCRPSRLARQRSAISGRDYDYLPRRLFVSVRRRPLRCRHHGISRAHSHCVHSSFDACTTGRFLADALLALDSAFPGSNERRARGAVEPVMPVKEERYELRRQRQHRH